MIDANQRTKRDTEKNDSNYYVRWYGGSGLVEEGGKDDIKDEGNGFHQGNTVTLSVDMSSGGIIWSVNGQRRATHQTDKLKKKSINWVPYVLIYSNGDSVEWLAV